ncbi:MULTISPECIES: nucleoside 2-deoxyribosyltransferase [Flavobacterium]|uniref:nucleoside 2-deoxyribosyltransferase n=1 Tax=Flavobacterium TaxID=237 RepID=UPI001FCC30C2|nr:MULTISPECIES: nucleoside 2-deoxyribosyltransferase [Flavobacterium]UOK42405.1 nucleoside 2-deoxyribosyltransferase [Flavobacterium enshiense]
MTNILIEIKKLENSCFVVMPFSSLYQIEYESIIKPTLQELNIKCIRGDEIYSKQRIMDDIWQSIKSCRFVIAELTGKNPNVLYEVGLAHAIGKPVIILTRNSDDVPFDLKDLRYLYYDINDPFWGENLKLGLKSLIQKVIDNPDIDIYLEGIKSLNKSDFPKINSSEDIKPKKIAPKKIVNLSGNWKGSWKNPDLEEHNIILNINQKDDSLSCVATINYYDDEGVITVVQQIFEGKITDNKISIQGVNYTYIERGNSEDYNLDNFQLEYSNNKLKGVTFDNKNEKTDIMLVKQ